MAMMPISPFVLFLLRFATLLSVFVMAVYVVRLVDHSNVKHFDIAADWLGHGGHGVGMSFMGLQMIGVIQSFGLWQIWTIFYGVCLIFFLCRLAARPWTKPIYPAWWDLVHLILSALMTGMFVPNVPATFLILGLVFYFPFTIFYFYETIQDFRKGSSYTGKLGDTAHVAMGIAMVIMFVTMLNMTQVSSTTQSPNLHDLNSMPGMNMP